MTIKQYIEEKPDWDIYEEGSLEFVEPDNFEEARVNLEYVINVYPCSLEVIGIVVCSYYGDTIDWQRI